MWWKKKKNGRAGCSVVEEKEEWEGRNVVWWKKKKNWRAGMINYEDPLGVSSHTRVDKQVM